MSTNKPLIDPLTEYILEESWQLSRQFMKIIEFELDLEDKVPIDILMASKELRDKWIKFASKN